MSERLENLLKEATSALAAARDIDSVLQIKARYIGRKGELALLLKEMGTLSPDERRASGEAINRAKDTLEAEVERLICVFQEASKAAKLTGERIDVTLPGRPLRLGRVHPVTRVMTEIEDIFTGLGFDIAEGPEVELDYYNFEALNFPKDHPARDMQDTFFIAEDVLLRTHTSAVQPRIMERSKPPLRVIAPGTVYRRDSDITHSPMFHQVEGFMVDKGIRFTDLKGILSLFLHRLFGPSTEVRFRPSFFPFTEPSAEVDIRCVICGGSGCRVCKGSGWLEVLGAGMIHPEVFKAAKYDPEEFTGFAFGLGVERIAMLKFGIDDLRLFFENDVRFLGQF
ncbi:MAG: phenylalanine--tRNA ligase subunit alpha [Deltaproteobacteria bacterium]